MCNHINVIPFKILIRLKTIFCKWLEINNTQSNPSNYAIHCLTSMIDQKPLNLAKLNLRPIISLSSSFTISTEGSWHIRKVWFKLFWCFEDRKHQTNSSWSHSSTYCTSYRWRSTRTNPSNIHYPSYRQKPKNFTNRQHHKNPPP